MNIAFCDGMLLQVVLHGGKATVLSKREIGADTINFYNYFARYCLSPEEPLLKLLNCADDEAIEIISGQPLVKQLSCWGTAEITRTILAWKRSNGSLSGHPTSSF